MKKYIVRLEQQIVSDEVRLVNIIECLIQANNEEQANKLALEFYPTVRGVVFYFLEEVKEVPDDECSTIENFITLLNPTEV